MNAKGILDGTYKITDVGGHGQYLAVVCGVAEGECRKPLGANDPRFLGFTQEAQPNQNKGVAVRIAGISRAVAAGAIAYGDYVNIAGATGKVQSCHALVTAAPGAASRQHVVGIAEGTAAADGDVIAVRIQPFIVNIAAS
jgi:hypothetical protein